MPPLHKRRDREIDLDDPIIMSHLYLMLAKRAMEGKRYRLWIASRPLRTDEDILSGLRYDSGHDSFLPS